LAIYARYLNVLKRLTTSFKLADVEFSSRYDFTPASHLRT
jgi:hypothetical protein